MTMRILVVIGFGASCLLLAAGEPKQYVRVSKMERVDFPSGGVLRLTNAVGILNVEAWDQPYVEITTIKSTKVDHDGVRVTAERRGNELVINTDYPRHFAFPRPYPMGGGTDFDLEYRIKAPSAARLIASLKVGEVNVDNLVADIQVILRQGEIMLHLPEDGRYDIHARSDFGAVNSDFPGPERRRWWFVGHRTLHDESPPARKLDLRVGFGDIVILKTRVPKAPGL
jgi:hypothetical protein